MPEGDTVFRTAANLREALVGKTLTRCDIRVPRYATVDLAGHTVDEVISRGKHLFIRVGPASIHSHLKMDGAWRVGPKGKPIRNAYKIRIILEADDIQALGIDLGILEILDREHDEDAVAHLGPDLLGDDWDPKVAAANLAQDPDRPIAPALLDQRNLAGVGNVFANELCFVFGRLPTSPVSSLPDPLRVVTRARDMLWANRTRVNRTTTGNRRGGQDLWVYGRAGEPCRRCGTPIRRADSSDDDRVTYWCPSCQR
ncbi:endonuclease VIII Nei2 [Mycolicibacterium sp. ELW1]|uniref:endonuclease VIII Nei2 n=1 Tax=Mycobacteriaceae TaxID=1762 RepID=UPI0011EE27DE|nr:endonuclease VIII Nei2 [Mycobacterium sp. ELW1]QEN15619.1 Fpg/Nei family DNA glycosylase [Mycobacterium sp. ELW1]